MKSSEPLRDDALVFRAKELGISPDDFRSAQGTIDEEALRRRIREQERYTSEFRFGLLVAVCAAAFVVCGLATWLAMSLLKP